MFSRQKAKCPLNIILALECLIHKAEFKFLLRVVSRLDDAHPQVELHCHRQGVKAGAKVRNGGRNQNLCAFDGFTLHTLPQWTQQSIANSLFAEASTFTLCRFTI